MQLGLTTDLAEFPDLPEYVWKPLQATFEQQARGIPLEQWKALAEKYLAHPTIPVRVAVVDLSLDQAKGPARSAHKEAVTGVIRSLLCADPDAPDCRRVVVSTRGVSPRLPAPGNTMGGRSTDREYAYLTFDELTSLLKDVIGPRQPDNEHLVLNLGVAWDPIKTAAANTPLDDPRMQPIFDLLRLASCRGAIVIAPAGNLTGSEGPMFPAAYEVEMVPDDAECARMQAPRRQKIGGQARLVYAVGALDSLDQRMITVRPGGQPRLAAYGLSVTAPRPVAPYIFSGTSMSAAIVSAAAAAVWSANPDWRADQVMTAVYEGGIQVDNGSPLPGLRFDTRRGLSDFCLGRPYGPCPDPVRRVFLCGALQRALPALGLKCADGPSQFSSLPELPKELTPKDLRQARQCDTTWCSYPVGPSIDQIPPGAVPQPGISGCPGCTLSLPNQNAFGYLIWDSLTPPQMNAGVVKVWTSNTANPSFTTDPWDVTQPFRFGIGAPSDTCCAVLSVSYIDGDGNLTTKDLPLNVRRK